MTNNEWRSDELEALLWRLSLAIRQADRSQFPRLIRDAMEAVYGCAVNPWLTQDEAAQYTGLTKGWLANARSRGDGPVFYRILGARARGSTVMYHAQDLDGFLAGHRVETRPFIPRGGFR